MFGYQCTEPTAQRWSSCFYCGGHLPSSSKEHIFNSSWTGKHKTGSLICDVCNSGFSSDVDIAFFPYTKFIMNVWALKGDRQKEAPTIKTADNMVIKPGGKAEQPAFFNLRREGENLHILAQAPDREALRRLLKMEISELESQMGRKLRDEERRYLKDLVRQGKYQKKDAGTVGFQETVDIESQVRSTLHTILKCMALYDAKFKDNIAETLLNFSRYGEGDWRNYPVYVDPPVVNIASVFAETSAQFNAVEVHYVPKSNQIIARLVILGRLSRWVVVSHQYEGPSQILFVAELSLSGKLSPIHFKIPENFPATVEVNRGMEEEDFYKDLVHLSQFSLGPDTILAQLCNQIDQIVEVHTHVTTDFIYACRQALYTCYAKMAHLHHKMVGTQLSNEDESQIRDKANLGFVEFEYRLGESIDSMNLANHVSQAIKRAISQRLLSQ